ncbi:MAG: hypothetical protein CMQ05_02085 [Gammaproteobacteria bacterium]|mgnify:CR=1|uniref:Uncharacterized protein n=1 Tax=OM182 bacterium MED-G24 TaxID=1986255 RepID=A0A2A5WYQ9_9GAMM|nr:hypothetical protein [Gammaproteobacteria bacterium]PDH41669.1 MAG: hypothetical protein CNE99_01195 [OM182 bacterium MED-G24]|tara:strand:- start:255 stop:650 length:396 start_codon:yes stop_codon:yes gene_type:complete
MDNVQRSAESEVLARQVADHIRTYSDTFGEAFHRGDPSLLRPFCHVPLVSLGRGRVFTVSTIEESDERWRRAHASLPKDYQNSVLHAVDVMMTDKRTALSQLTVVGSTKTVKNTTAFTRPMSRYSPIWDGA